MNGNQLTQEQERMLTEMLKLQGPHHLRFEDVIQEWEAANGVKVSHGDRQAIYRSVNYLHDALRRFNDSLPKL